MPRKRQNIIGTQMGYWQIISSDADKKTSNGIKRIVVAKCRCGTVRSVLEQNIISGQSKSCGCLQKERAKAYQELVWKKRKSE